MQVAYEIKTTHCGKSLIASENIKKGTIIWKYDSDVPTETLSLDDILSLPKEERECFETYCWQTHYDPPRWEGTKKNPESDPTNFINHSCRPNMWFDGDDTLTARRDITAGEHLTIAYWTCDTTFAEIETCLCNEYYCYGSVSKTDAYKCHITAPFDGHMRSCIQFIYDNIDINEEP